MAEFEHPDLVDTFYHPFVRPIGNLAITFAQTEARLRELLTFVNGGDETAANNILESETEIRDFAESSGSASARAHFGPPDKLLRAAPAVPRGSHSFFVIK